MNIFPFVRAQLKVLRFFVRPFFVYKVILYEKINGKSKDGDDASVRGMFNVHATLS